ncbi:hypothetical protein Krac_2631 [Ktedonobacter racemifer DSM 44963]|uniref:Uncharacterized protein n=1 Tax=Ktedonobacter racemifer DSM 44963 TaxID=485913 RepID=D6TZ84_KTERA|nr:hypothetical protein Krac_2631 [Ktedonobacter racemifer DSM 44963]
MCYQHLHHINLPWCIYVFSIKTPYIWVLGPIEGIFVYLPRGVNTQIAILRSNSALSQYQFIFMRYSMNIRDIGRDNSHLPFSRIEATATHQAVASVIFSFMPDFTN